MRTGTRVNRVHFMRNTLTLVPKAAQLMVERLSAPPSPSPMPEVSATRDSEGTLGRGFGFRAVLTDNGPERLEFARA